MGHWASALDWVPMLPESSFTKRSSGFLTRSRRFVMTPVSRFIAFVSFALIVGAATAAWAQSEKLGTVDFKTSCSAPAHAQFNRAVALLHSFVLDGAVKGFTEAAQTDPSCGIADRKSTRLNSSHSQIS